MKQALSRFGLGAALLTLCISMSAVALYEQRVVDAAIYMTTTVLALAVAYASASDRP